MIHMLQKGAKVMLWPRPGLTVKIGPDQMAGGRMLPSRTLADAGEEVDWSEWWNDLAKGGAVYFSDPRENVTHAVHVHPDDLEEHLASLAEEAKSAKETTKQAAAGGKAEG